MYEITNNNNKWILGLAAGIFLLLVLLAGGYFLKAQEAKQLRAELQTQKTNGKVASFLDLFIQKVLKTDKEVSFEDRLQLENAVRDINDQEILAKWEQFTNGQTESQIQDGVKALLEVLARKIVY